MIKEKNGRKLEMKTRRAKKDEATIQSKCLDLRTFLRLGDNQCAVTMDKFHVVGFLAEN